MSSSFYHYYGYAYDPNYIAHDGVKGMRWGMRKKDLLQESAAYKKARKLLETLGPNNSDDSDNSDDEEQESSIDRDAVDKLKKSPRDFQKKNRKKQIGSSDNGMQNDTKRVKKQTKESSGVSFVRDPSDKTGKRMVMVGSPSSGGYGRLGNKYSKRKTR